MKVLIVEDEQMARRSLERMLLRLFPDIEVVGECASVRETVDWLRGNSADVIFMDVELSDGVCFEIFRQVKVEAKVVMTTAYDSYALKAFEAGSIDYLLKPIEPDALTRAVGRCRMSGGVVDVDSLMRRLYKERYLVRFNDRIVPVEVQNIAFFCSEDKNNYLVTFDRQRYIIDSSLDELSACLDPQVFFRISRNCIVSLKSIESIVKLVGGRLKVISSAAGEFEMVVSRSRVDDFLNWLER